jgi:uncharacterized 2Fe-2S/4Fe-4S cluster protein (DUF4445 family)
MDSISPKERIFRVFDKKNVDRPPVVCPGGMMNAALVDIMNSTGHTLPEAHKDDRLMAALADDVYTHTGFENFGIPFCMTVEAEVLGSEINFGTLNCEPKIQAERFADVSKVEYKDIEQMLKQGRISNVVQAGWHLSRKNADVPVIDNAKPVGICGSGLVDIVGELVFHNIIGKNGKFNDGKKEFSVANDVVLTQKDVRQVQLAKGAIRAGIEYLLKAKNTLPEQVDRVLIAGSFGYHLRAKSLINIGLLPREFEGKIEFVGNTSSSGGRAFLLGKQYRAKMEKKVGEIEVLELANMPDFEKLFVQTLSF